MAAIEVEDHISTRKKKKKQRKNKMQNFLGGRTKRRIDSAESHSSLEQDESVWSASVFSSSSSASSSKFYSNEPDDISYDAEEQDFLEMLHRIQSSRLDDQRSTLPAVLAQTRTGEELIENNSVENHPSEVSNMEPIREVLALGAPYPLVVLPVEGDYWMEGTNHILQKDMQNRPTIPRVDLSKYLVESDDTANAYRESFLGREHLNFAAVDSKYGPLLLSVKCETSALGDGMHNDSRDYYEVILRMKDKTIHQFLPSGSLSEHPRPREFIQCIIHDELDIDRFHPIAIPKISEQIVKYDEHVLTSCYKIGVFYQKHGQTTEEEYFGNRIHSRSMAEFLDCIANKVKLEGFKGYRGGLDVKYNQTGEYSYHTTFKNREFMFHVSSLLPYNAGDVQQLQRKRHIGNDIVALVFQDENTPFCPSSIRSHFLHVFIVVQVLDANTPNVRYKVSVTARDGVPTFGPRLPNPAVFRKGEEFRQFLMTKILNAELAACKSDKFSQLAVRTRAMLMQQLVSDLILKNEQILEEGELHRTYSGGKGSILSSFRSALGNSKTRNGSNQSLNSNSGLQAPYNNGLSRSLNDITDVGDDSKKEKKKLFSKKTSRDHSRENERKESKSASHLPSSTNAWPNSSQQGSLQVNGDYTRSKSAENGVSRKSLQQNYFCDTGSTNSSPSLSNHRLGLSSNPEMSNRPDSNLTPDRYSRELRTGSYDEEELRQMDPRLMDSNYISVSSCSSSYEDVSTSSACSALDAAQREIDILRSEIGKLKSDKMDLVRQNVVYQREIRRFKEKSLHQTAQLYSVQHELSKVRLSQDGESSVNHISSPVNHELRLTDIDKTPVRHNTEVVNHNAMAVNHSLNFNGTGGTPVNQERQAVHQERQTVHQDEMATHSEMTPVRAGPRLNNRPMRSGNHLPKKRHSISHV